MEQEYSLPHAQEPATCPYSGQVAGSCAWPDQSSPWPSSNFLNRHFNIILYYIPTYTWVFPVVSFPQVSPQNTVCTSLLPHTRYTPSPSHSSWFDARKMFGEECRSLSSSLGSFLHSLVISSLLGPNILLNTLFSNTFSLISSFNLSDHVSHPYTTGKIIVLCIIIFKFLDSKLEDKIFCTER